MDFLPHLPPPTNLQHHTLCLSRQERPFRSQNRVAAGGCVRPAVAVAPVPGLRGTQALSARRAPEVLSPTATET